MGDSDRMPAPTWITSPRILVALELDGVGIVQRFEERSKGPWYGFPAVGDQVLGPFASVEEAKRAVEEAHSSKPGR
jgi:hypothetical protein